MASKFHRTTITIPQSLKTRMDAVQGPVNWSALAARAFEAKLREVEMRDKKALSKEEIVKRLQASQTEDAQRDHEAGKEAGKEWAGRQATAKQLKRAAQWVRSFDDTPIDWWDVDSPNWTAPFGPTDRFVFAVLPDRKDDRDAPAEFWKRALGDEADRIADGDFFHGFVDGAVELWQEVHDEL
jgi:hypothetical protein